VRTTKSYASVPPFGERIETLANGPALDEQHEECPFSDGPGNECHGCREQRREEEMRAAGTAELHDEHGVVFGVAHWRWLHVGMRWCAHSLARPNVRTIGKTVAAVTRQLARKLETR